MDGIMRKLPIGIQTFEKLREGGYLYVDKTAFVWKMPSFYRDSLFPKSPPSFWKKSSSFHFRSIL